MDDQDLDRDSARERQAAYSARRRSGRREVRVAVWVPKDRADDLRLFAAKLRAHADLEAGRSSKTPLVVIPKIKVPEVPPPGWAYLRVGKEEVWLHKLLRANNAKWLNETTAPVPNTWRIRSDLVEKLGLESRVVCNKEA